MAQLANPLGWCGGRFLVALAAIGLACAGQPGREAEGVPAPLGAGCLAARLGVVTNPTMSAVDAFAGSKLLGTVGARSSDQFWLGSSDPNGLRFNWHSRTSYRSRDPGDLSQVSYQIHCVTEEHAQ